MERKLKLEDEPTSATPIPQFEEPIITVPTIPGARRHPVTAVICFSDEEWEREEKLSKEKQE